MMSATFASRIGFGVLLVSSFARSARAQELTVLRGVTVIDGNGDAPRPNQVVLIRGDRIDRVGNPSEVPIPKQAKVRDLNGRFLLPGFIDMHAHVAFGPVFMDKSGSAPAIVMKYDQGASRSLASTLLGFGITTIRNPGAPAREGVALRDSIRMGYLPGPRIFTAGEVIDAVTAPGLVATVKTEAEIRAEVDRQARLGVDYIKLYASLSPAMIAAGVDQAHQHGLKAIGHLFGTSWTAAAKSGIDGIVHIIPGTPLLLPESQRAAFRQSFRGTQFMLEWFNYVDFESPEIKEMLAALTANHVTIDPTLVVFDALARGDQTVITQNPDLRFTPPSLLANWRGDFTFDMAWAPGDHDKARAAWPNVLRFTKLLYDSGVLLTVGTDVPNPWVAPGVSFHQELKLLTDAGLSPLQVLTMATRNGAQSLGVLSDVGTIEPGKRADLVVLAADPTANINNTRSIEWVIQSGRWITPIRK